MNFATMTIAFPKMAATTARVEPWVAILLVVESVCVFENYGTVLGKRNIRRTLNCTG